MISEKFYPLARFGWFGSQSLELFLPGSGFGVGLTVGGAAGHEEEEEEIGM